MGFKSTVKDLNLYSCNIVLTFNDPNEYEAVGVSYFRKYVIYVDVNVDLEIYRQ